LPESWTFILAVIGSALVGGIIGSSTNWLAILVIFRWIIPRKKGELAQAIQNVVSADLMPVGKIREKLRSSQVRSVIRLNIDHFIQSFLNRGDGSLAELLRERPQVLEAALARLEEALGQAIEARLSEPDFETRILSPFVRHQLELNLNRPLDGIVPLDRGWLSQRAGELVRSALGSSSLRRSLAEILGAAIHDYIAARPTLGQLIPALFHQVIIAEIRRQTPFLVSRFADLLREEEIQAALTEAVRTAINGQLRAESGWGGTISRFVAANLDLNKKIGPMVGRLPDALEADLSRPDRRAVLEQALARNMTLWLADDSGFFSLSLGPAEAMDLSTELLDRLLGRETIDLIGERVQSLVEEQAGQALSRLLERLPFQTDLGRLADLISGRIKEALVSEPARELIGRQVRDFLASLVRTPLSRLLSVELRTRLAELIELEVQGLVESRLEEFTRASGIWDTVADSINSYDEREVERLIRKLANRELRAVILLGFVIGLAVGALQGGLLLGLPGWMPWP